MRLKIDRVEFCYEARKVLDRISFEAEEGEFIGLVGPNGSGKTTLLKVINRILEPKVGAVYLNCRKISEMSWREIAREMAMVPQNTQLDFGFKVFDIVMMGRHPYLGRFSIESEADEEKVRYWMKLTNVLNLADRPISELSGGERQRVLIARTLAQEPKILLLDEPTANLDICYQIEIMDLLKRLVKELKLIIICAIHDLNLAARYSDRIILLKDGRIIEIGEPSKVLTRKNLRDVFNIDARIEYDGDSGTPLIIPIRPSRESTQMKKRADLVMRS